MSNLTAPQRIKRHIMSSKAGQEVLSEMDVSFTPDDGQEIDEVFAELQAKWLLQDAVSEFREGTHETEIPTPYSRNYESKSVAAKLDDGTWVGWTFWYGKFGDPEAIDWLEEAYDLEVKEEEKMVTVFTFTRKNCE